MSSVAGHGLFLSIVAPTDRVQAQAQSRTAAVTSLTRRKLCREPERQVDVGG